MSVGSARAYKGWMLLAAALLLAVSGLFQRELNTQRADPKLGLVRITDLGSNAPPVLAFTTVALGGFRGLIANALWIRANDLQTEGKYFEMVQLADWITKLQPTFAQVWVVQAWNMAYNISVKFTSPDDRWRWVQRGIELLRDNALLYNPREAAIYRELAWFYQHKMGQNMDDAHLTYKKEWAKQMEAVIPGGRPNYPELLQPTTEAARRQVQILREQYRLEPHIMKELDDQFGPLEWRLPDAHAMYWSWVGMKHCPAKERMPLRRVLYQTMHQIVMRGRLLSVEPLRFAPDLEKAERGNAAYVQMIKDDPEMRDAIANAHRNYLRETTYFLYTYNRLADATRFLNYLRQEYPGSVPDNWTIDEFALERIKSNIAEMSQDRTRAMLNGIIHQYYVSLALDEDDRVEGFDRMMRQLYTYWDTRIAIRRDPLQFPPLEEMKRVVLQEVLDPKKGLLSPELIARLRTRLNLPAPTATATTNSTPAKLTQ